MSIHTHQRPTRGATDEWLTPPHVIDDLGPFDLDPCAPVNRPWDTAETHYTVEDDGLSRPWHGFVWLNPPYGPEAAEWVARLADHGQGIALVFARTETAWWQEHIWPKADAIRFLYKRLHFHYPDGSRASFNAGAPSALVGYGLAAVGRLQASSLPGALVVDPETG